MLFNLDVGIFWDNVLLVSKTGKAIFESGTLSWKIPYELDTGHPPFTATVIALGWHLFGKSLAVSHWLMLPFIFGFFWQIHTLVAHFIKGAVPQIFAFVLVIADPTLLAQLVTVNTEISLLFFFFLTLNGLLNNRPVIMTIGLAFLSVVSLRGMMLCAGIFLLDVFIQIFQNKNSIRSFFTQKKLLIYFFGALPAITFLTWRFFSVGWFLGRPDSLYENHWQLVSLKQFIRNCAVFMFTFIDFGRIAVLLVASFSLYFYRKHVDTKICTLVAVAIIPITPILLTSLLAQNPMGHRYFIVAFLVIGLLTFYMLQKFKLKKIVYPLVLSSLILGNFIVYPDHFAQGWDGSLAHLPYWECRQEAMNYLDENDIAIDTTATFFPNHATVDDVDLNNDLRMFKNFTGKETYVLYSNVYNLSDNTLGVLKNEYTVEMSFEKRNVRVEILKKKHSKK